ncbi:unnamed protein product [Rhodiola kirilowii]
MPRVANNDVIPDATRTAAATVTDDIYSFNNNEITGSSIVSEVLVGRENFITWSKSMEIALSVRSKLEFVLGKHPKPSDPALHSKWKRCNDVILTWLLNSVSKKIVNHILHAKDVAHAWRILHIRYAGSNVSRKFYLKKEVSNIKQGDMDVAGFFEKLNAYWKELDAMSKLVGCDEDSECSNCRISVKEKEEDRVIEFLMGLNEDYAHTRTHILALRELPSLDVVYDMVHNAESQQKVTKSVLVEASALYSNQQDSNGYSKGQMRNAQGKPRGKLYCTHCQMNGHTKEFCYKLNGYPPGHKMYEGNSRSNGRNSSDSKPANMVTREGNDDTNNQEGSRNKTDQVPQLNSSQINQLIALLKKNDSEGGANTHHMAGICLLSSKINGRSVEWVIDSGATDHFTCNLELLFDVHKVTSSCSVLLPNGEVSQVELAGKFALTKDLILHDVFYVPSFKFNLISVSKLTGTSPCDIVFSKGTCVIQDHAHKISLGIGKLMKGLYYPEGSNPVSNSICTATIKQISPAVWHKRLGHLPLNKMKRALNSVENDVKVTDCNFHCSVCPMAKQSRLSFPISQHKSTEIFELLHADVWGPFGTSTMSGCRYFLTLVDDYSRNTWTYLMQQKSEVPVIVIKFFNMVETQFFKKIKKFRSDNGSEFFNETLTNFFSEKGCIHQSSCVYTPQQNGVVERKHRHLLDIARALRLQASLPKVFWGDCVLSATYLINRAPSALLNFKSPMEILFGSPPSLQHLRVIGCLCYVGTLPHHRDKLDPRATPCVFLGYPYGQKGYKVYCLQSHQILVSRDVTFFEEIFPYKEVTSDSVNNAESTVHLPTTVHVPIIPENGNSDADYVPPFEPAPNADPQPVAAETQNAIQVTTHDQVAIQNATQVTTHDQVPLVRRSSRHHQPPVWQSEYVCNNSIKIRKSPHCIQKFLSNSHCSTTHAAFAVAVANLKELKTYAQACKDVQWCEAMDKENAALQVNNTWIITDPPPNQPITDCKWIYRIKLKSDGTIERYKARLVAKGFTQIEGVDYNETFAPVAKMTSVRCLLTVAAIRCWPIFQLDVDNAFLHGNLDEDVYMHLPPGYFKNERSAGKVCKLTKSLYGLKQAPRQWFSKLTEALLEFGFHQSLNDHSLFTLEAGNDFIILLVYVDDVLLTGTSLQLINSIKAFIHDKFRIKDLGTLKYFFGLEVARNESGIFLHQKKYAVDLLGEYDMLDCKPAKTPLPIKHQLSLSTAAVIDDPMTYRKLVGKLIYLTITRPNLSHSVHILSQYMQAPTSDHMKAAHRLLRYIKRAPAQGLFFSATSKLVLSAYCDADWAACPKTRRSTTGFCVLIGDSLVSWKTMKQAIVSRSSAESEYRAMAAVCSEILWLSRLLSDMKAVIPTPISLYCDNQAAIHIARNPVFHERKKHIELDCHFVRHHIGTKTLQAVYVPTEEQPADLFTKQLPSDHLNRLLSKLGVSNFLHSPA